MKQSVQAFGVMLLVLTGLGGVIYNLFRDEGWLEMVVSGAFNYAMESPLALGFMVCLTVFLIVWWRHDRITRGRHGKGPTYVLYAIMAAGAYFLGKLALMHTL